MTKKVKLTKNIGGHNTGDTITVTNGVAEHLEQAGAIEKPKTSTRKTDTTDD